MTNPNIFDVEWYPTWLTKSLNGDSVAFTIYHWIHSHAKESQISIPYDAVSYTLGINRKLLKNKLKLLATHGAIKCIEKTQRGYGRYKVFVDAPATIADTLQYRYSVPQEYEPFVAALAAGGYAVNGVSLPKFIAGMIYIDQRAYTDYGSDGNVSLWFTVRLKAFAEAIGASMNTAQTVLRKLLENDFIAARQGITDGCKVQVKARLVNMCYKCLPEGVATPQKDAAEEKPTAVASSTLDFNKQEEVAPATTVNIPVDHTYAMASQLSKLYTQVQQLTKQLNAQMIINQEIQKETALIKSMLIHNNSITPPREQKKRLFGFF